MVTNLECIPCIISSLLRLLKIENNDEGTNEQIVRNLLKFLSDADYQSSPPILAKEIHRFLCEKFNTDDPYKDIKLRYNNLMLDLYPHLEEMVKSTEDPINLAMRLAVAGNVIDFGPQFQMDIMKTIDEVVYSKFAIDDSNELKSELKSANSLLYVGDNCGEIVMDKLFLSMINLPQMHYAVRQSPVINDVTIEDAKYVGIDKLANIISIGDNTPGAVWDYTSDEFRTIFNNADIVISKGQGNLEGLIDVNHNIYFMLVVKCDLIGKLIGAQKGDFIIKKSQRITSETERKKNEISAVLID